MKRHFNIFTEREILYINNKENVEKFYKLIIREM